MHRVKYVWAEAAPVDGKTGHRPRQLLSVFSEDNHQYLQGLTCSPRFSQRLDHASHNARLSSALDGPSIGSILGSWVDTWPLRMDAASTLHCNPPDVHLMPAPLEVLPENLSSLGRSEAISLRAAPKIPRYHSAHEWYLDGL